MAKKERWGAKRIMGLSLAMLMAVVLVLTGCSSGNKEGMSSPSAESSASATDTQADSSATPKVVELEPVNLIWYLRQSEPNNMESVLKKFNEMVYDKIKVNVEFRYINPGDYNDKMQLVMTSGEDYDLAFTANWANSYLNNVSRGAYVPLNELIDQYPDLKELFRKEVWDAVSVNGKIYGVPNNQIMSNQGGFWFKKDLVDKYNIDLSSIKSNEDLGKALQIIKDNEPGIIPLRAGQSIMFSDFQSAVEGIPVDPNTLKVIDNSEDLLQRYKLMREFNQKGFFPADVATMKNEDALIKEGKIFSRYSRIKPGVESELMAQYGYEFVTITASDPVISAGAVMSTITAVSATSKHPDRAVMLLNLINKDKEIFNTLTVGLEGQDYKKVSENHIELIEGGYAVANWTVGNVFNSYLLQGQADDVWEQTKKVDDLAIVDPLISFSFDRTPVESELARLSAIRTEFTPVLENGLDDAEKMFKEYQDKRKASGLDKVIAEIEKQLAEFKK
jgi:putative aldouronate transport system substrate-binding protein